MCHLHMNSQVCLLASQMIKFMSCTNLTKTWPLAHQWLLAYTGPSYMMVHFKLHLPVTFQEYHPYLRVLLPAQSRRTRNQRHTCRHCSSRPSRFQRSLKVPMSHIQASWYLSWPQLQWMKHLGCNTLCHRHYRLRKSSLANRYLCHKRMQTDFKRFVMVYQNIPGHCMPYFKRLSYQSMTLLVNDVQSVVSNDSHGQVFKSGWQVHQTKCAWLELWLLKMLIKHPSREESVLRGLFTFLFI